MQFLEVSKRIRTSNPFLQGPGIKESKGLNEQGCIGNKRENLPSSLASMSNFSTLFNSSSSGSSSHGFFAA
jgi:hypothetical protein